MEAIKTEPESADGAFPIVPITQYGRNDENDANIVTNENADGDDSIEIPEVKMEVPEDAGNFIHIKPR